MITILFLMNAFLTDAAAAPADTAAVYRSAGAIGNLSDDWWGQDKFMHFYVSAGIGASVFYVCHQRLDHGEGAGAGYAVSITGLVGLGKELYDSVRKKHFSLKDLFWDSAGIAAAYIIFMRHY